VKVLVVDILESMSITKYIQRTYNIVPPCLNDQSGTAWNLYNYDGYIPTNYILLGDSSMTVYYRAHTMSLSQMKYRINLALALSIEEEPAIANQASLKTASITRNNIAISYTLPYAANVQLNIYDSAGKMVGSLSEGMQSSGNHYTLWSPESNGIYFVKLFMGKQTLTNKVIILK